MSPGERSELESRADRLIRRGEMAEAMGVLQTLAQAFPGDAGVERRIADVSEALQPAELHHPKARGASDPVGPDGSGSTPEQEGERLFALGDFAGATAAYRRALMERPDSELLRERLEELFRLAQPGGGKSAAHPPPPPGPLPARREGIGTTQAYLQQLLDRIAARRRV